MSRVIFEVSGTEAEQAEMIATACAALEAAYPPEQWKLTCFNYRVSRILRAMSHIAWRWDTDRRTIRERVA